MLLVETPAHRTAERNFALEVLLTDILGLAWRVQPGPRRDLRISRGGEDDGALLLPDSFLSMPEADWLRPGSVPAAVARWDPVRAGLQAALVEPELPVLAPGDGDYALPIDLVGGAFFMLSRYEEVAAPVADRHERYPARASLAARENFLYRPIVEEYAEVLWAALSRQWPALSRRRREGAMRLSCDVDHPFDPTVATPARLLRTMAGDLVKRRSPALAARRAQRYVANRRGDFSADPYHTFDFYLDSCRQTGHRAAFYFIPEQTNARMDGTYAITSPPILTLMRKLAAEGHEIGAHGSYDTFRDPALIRRERDRLIDACRRAGVDASVAGNRQHYLRWDARQTPDHLEAAGYGYDTSGGFADMPGFRYGTAHPFRMWSWQCRAPLALVQRPLIVMEASILNAGYLNLGAGEQSFGLMALLRERALRYGGDFTLLWHNSELIAPADRNLFLEVLRLG